MQLDIRNGKVHQKVFVDNGINTVVHVFKHAEDVWEVKCGPRRDEFYLNKSNPKIRTFIHGSLVVEGVSRFDFYSDELVVGGVLIKNGNEYMLHPGLKASIDALGYLSNPV